MNLRNRDIPVLIAEELNSCGKPWRIENGGHHLKLFVNDRFVGILPRNVGDTSWAGRRRNLNVRSQIRRAAKEQS